ncbi:16S rRNA (guanine(527)-N(7))-methyltransferase RsmG [uncultured Thermanaerothrix sp.]|uniref:16S rRNA (guanine(527)-N(7))-methyltransferase RsmG n=1 Tax=uncultured Thermanaerothrix sp. TaxID=1195149 RepID=UPI0026175126|nr:16S rRNA (guanine(527)-N(7))-methyltransferase RsmG [uncultured Thermanaerothrix sp.]
MEKFAQDVQNLLGIKLTPRQRAAFATYEQELLAWNTRFNLTAIRDPEGIRTKHFLDSLTCILAWRNSTPPQSLIDIGTGAGFPGLPLKILLPHLEVTLVDSVGKKLAFCRHIVEVLKLEKVTLIQGRAEELGQDPAHRERYDWAVARAVANMPVLVEYLLPLVRVGGAMLAQKGASGPAETQGAERAIRILGGQLQQILPVYLPGVAEERYLIVIRKQSATPPSYPRRVGLPAKKPIQ